MIRLPAFRLPRAVTLLVAAGASATVIASAFIGEKEGLSLAAYQDGARVWTICRGHTRDVKPGQIATPAECDRLFASEIGRTLAHVDILVTVPMSAARHAAVASFAFNVGVGALARSTFLKKLNAADPSACAEILRWVFVDGKDCREPASNCQGIVVRRQQEAELCRL